MRFLKPTRSHVGRPIELTHADPADSRGAATVRSDKEAARGEPIIPGATMAPGGGGGFPRDL